jgi:polyisoprenoid-binding protein YceI
MRLFALLALTVTTAQAADAIPAPSVEPAPAGRYEIDKSHTSLTFRVNHLGFSRFTGRFTGVDAKLAFDPAKLAASSVQVTIDPKTISSDNAPEGFLAALAGNKWLDAGRHPQLTFVSRSVEALPDNGFRIQGELTMRGVTKPLTLEGRYNGGYAGHPYDPRARAGFSARGTLKRSDYGISLGIPSAATGNFGVSDEVDVTLETEFSGPAWKAVAQN